MFYVAICKRCNYVMFSDDLATFKTKVAEHFATSHNYRCYKEYTPLKMLRDNCYIIKADDNIGDFLKVQFKSPQFWHTFRNSSRLAQQFG